MTKAAEKKVAAPKATTKKVTAKVAAPKATKKVVKVKISYSKQWSYKRNFATAKDLITNAYSADEVEIEDDRETSKTDNFDISINGKLVHSKKKMGHQANLSNQKGTLEAEAVLGAIKSAMGQ